MRWPSRLPRSFHGRDRSSGRLVQPRVWPRRHWVVSTTSLVVIAVAATFLTVVLHEPEAPCGPGLSAVGTPPVCVGLDADSVGFADDSPLADLTDDLAETNAAITGSATTIVLLDNMTPDPRQDSDAIVPLRHRIQGAMTAVRRANEESVAGGTEPKIKLLLASYGSRAESWSQAVAAIRKAREPERIAAVTGIGQSLDNTRQAVAALSAAGIATVGSVVTADDMNTDLDGEPIQHFVRVAPTNTDEARAMVSYLGTHAYQRVMLIHDLNGEDSYSRTLASAFTTEYQSRVGAGIPFTDPYRSPRQQLNGAERDEYMTNRFVHMRPDICVNRPDVVVFAGRSADLVSFMRALAEGGSCGIRSLDIVTGDDAANIAGTPLPASGHLGFRVFYTALAHDAQWDTASPDSDNRKNYDAFTEMFFASGFGQVDLADGHAMMSHDAALTAITAIRRNPLATSDPSTVSDYLLGMRCTNTIPGATGVIALERDGNPANKAMPILQIRADGFLEQEGLVWPAGAPLDPRTTCA